MDELLESAYEREVVSGGVLEFASALLRELEHVGHALPDTVLFADERPDVQRFHSNAALWFASGGVGWLEVSDNLDVVYQICAGTWFGDTVKHYDAESREHDLLACADGQTAAEAALEIRHFDGYRAAGFY